MGMRGEVAVNDLTAMEGEEVIAAVSDANGATTFRKFRKTRVNDRVVMGMKGEIAVNDQVVMGMEGAVAKRSAFIMTRIG